MLVRPGLIPLAMGAPRPTPVDARGSAVACAGRVFRPDPRPASWRMTMAKVAFLGLGVMGYPMAGHLRTKGGHDVTVYNRTTAKADKWVQQYGGKSAATPQAAAQGQDFVMACVGNDNDLREVTLGAN